MREHVLGKARGSERRIWVERRAEAHLMTWREGGRRKVRHTQCEVACRKAARQQKACGLYCV
eukprot:802897-Pleurochrysis_carterae.AAC.1